MNSNEKKFLIETKNRSHNLFDKEIEKKWNGPFTFIQAADTQFGLIDRYIYKKDEPNWSKEINYLRLTIKSINSLNPKPKFIVICGDLVDAYPYQDFSNLREAQIKDLKEILVELDSEIKLVCVCGNHDVGDEPTIESVNKYKSDFGDDYFSFWSNGCKCIALNSQLYFNSKNVPQLKSEQDQWLDNELKQDNWKHLLVFQHIPLFIKTHDEPSHIYFNIGKEQRENLLDRFEKSGVSKVFCGHYHQNAGGFYKNLEIVVTSAVGAQLGNDKHGYRLVEVDEKEIQHRYIEISNEVN